MLKTTPETKKDRHMIKTNRLFLGGLPVDDCSEIIVDQIISLSKSKKQSIITYLNPYVFTKAIHNNHLKSLIKKSDLVYPDGWGIIFALRMLGENIKSRITTADFFLNFCKHAVKNRIIIGFIGGQKKQSKDAIKNIKTEYPNLDITFIHDGYFNPIENKKVINSINKIKPNLLIVGMGTPKQEAWVQKNMKYIDINCIWTVGSLLEYFSGKSRAPKWIRDNYMEWIFRLTIEPRRLFKRYTIEHGKFIFWLIIEKIKSIKTQGLEV